MYKCFVDALLGIYFPQLCSTSDVTLASKGFSTWADANGDRVA